MDLSTIRERARAALAAQPAPAAPEPGVDWEAIVQERVDQLHRGMMSPLKRSHPIGRKDRRPKPARPVRNADRPPELPSGEDLEVASGQVLRLYQDGGGKLRRHLADQERADDEQQVQTPPEPVQAGFPGQEGQRDGQTVDAGTKTGSQGADHGNKTLGAVIRPENVERETNIQPEQPETRAPVPERGDLCRGAVSPGRRGISEGSGRSEEMATPSRKTQTKTRTRKSRTDSQADG